MTVFLEYRKDEEAGEARDALEYVTTALTEEVVGSAVAEGPAARSLTRGLRAWVATVRPPKGGGK